MRLEEVSIVSLVISLLCLQIALSHEACVHGASVRVERGMGSQSNVTPSQRLEKRSKE